MQTLIRGTLDGGPAEIRWTDGVIDCPNAELRAQLLEATAAKKRVSAGAQWGSTAEPPSLSNHRDFVFLVIALLDTDPEIEGDMPYIEPTPPGAVS